MNAGRNLNSGDLESLRMLKARYCRTVDTKEWDEFATLFASDAVIGPIENGFPPELLAERPPEARVSTSPAVSVELFIVRARTNMGSVVTTHHVHQSEIRATAPDEAEGCWAMDDLLFWPATGRRFRGTGHYRDRFRKVDGVWLFRSVELKRLYTYAERVDPV